MKFKSKPEAYFHVLGRLNIILSQFAENSENYKTVKEHIESVREYINNHEQDISKILSTLSSLKNQLGNNLDSHYVKSLENLFKSIKGSDYNQTNEEKIKNDFGRIFESSLQVNLLLNPTEKMMRAVGNISELIIENLSMAKEEKLDEFAEILRQESNVIAFGSFNNDMDKKDIIDQMFNTLQDNNPDDLIRIMFIHFKFASTMSRRADWQKTIFKENNSYDKIAKSIMEAADRKMYLSNYYRDRGRAKDHNEISKDQLPVTVKGFDESKRTKQLGLISLESGIFNSVLPSIDDTKFGKKDIADMKESLRLKQKAEESEKKYKRNSDYQEYKDYNRETHYNYSRPVVKYKQNLDPLSWVADCKAQRPDFNSAYVQELLKHDIPYVAGPSGMTSLLMGQASVLFSLDSEINKNSSEIERCYLAAVAAYIVGGGFHSLHEVLGPVRYCMEENRFLPTSYNSGGPDKEDKSNLGNYQDFYLDQMNNDKEFTSKVDSSYEKLQTFYLKYSVVECLKNYLEHTSNSFLSSFKSDSINTARKFIKLLEGTNSDFQSILICNALVNNSFLSGTIVDSLGFKSINNAKEYFMSQIDKRILELLPDGVYKNSNQEERLKIYVEGLVTDKIVEHVKDKFKSEDKVLEDVSKELGRVEEHLKSQPSAKANNHTYRA